MVRYILKRIVKRLGTTLAVIALSMMFFAVLGDQVSVDPPELSRPALAS